MDGEIQSHPARIHVNINHKKVHHLESGISRHTNDGNPALETMTRSIKNETSSIKVIDSVRPTNLTFNILTVPNVLN